VLFGPAADVGALADRVARIAPLTDADAEDLLRSMPGTVGACQQPCPWRVGLCLQPCR
jgi:hypothetical protein